MIDGQAEDLTLGLQGALLPAGSRPGLGCFRKEFLLLVNAGGVKTRRKSVGLVRSGVLLL